MAKKKKKSIIKTISFLNHFFYTCVILKNFKFHLRLVGEPEGNISDWDKWCHTLGSKETLLMKRKLTLNEQNFEYPIGTDKEE